MTDRLKKIFNEIPFCEVFADIGCDHGYIAKEMLDEGRCNRVIISDISAECLKKAEKLLADYLACGKAESVVSDGFDKIKYCDTALIAGMGGEEIISIIENANSLPKNLILQPMKNCDKVRLLVLKRGYRIKKDFVFKSSDKFYDLIVLEKGEDKLSNEEVLFGRTNIKERPSAFTQRLSIRINKILEYVSSGRLSDTSKAEMEKELEILKKYV